MSWRDDLDENTRLKLITDIYHQLVRITGEAPQKIWQSASTHECDLWNTCTSKKAYYDGMTERYHILSSKETKIPSNHNHPTPHHHQMINNEYYPSMYQHQQSVDYQTIQQNHSIQNSILSQSTIPSARSSEHQERPSMHPSTTVVAASAPTPPTTPALMPTPASVQCSSTQVHSTANPNNVNDNSCFEAQLRQLLNHHHQSDKYSAYITKLNALNHTYWFDLITIYAEFSKSRPENENARVFLNKIKYVLTILDEEGEFGVHHRCLEDLHVVERFICEVARPILSQIKARAYMASLPIAMSSLVQPHTHAVNTNMSDNASSNEKSMDNATPNGNIDSSTINVPPQSVTTPPSSTATISSTSPTSFRTIQRKNSNAGPAASHASSGSSTSRSKPSLAVATVTVADIQKWKQKIARLKRQEKRYRKHPRKKALFGNLRIQLVNQIKEVYRQMKLASPKNATSAYEPPSSQDHHHHHVTSQEIAAATPTVTSTTSSTSPSIISMVSFGSQKNNLNITTSEKCTGQSSSTPATLNYTQQFQYSLGAPASSYLPHSIIQDDPTSVPSGPKPLTNAQLKKWKQKIKTLEKQEQKAKSPDERIAFSLLRERIVESISQGMEPPSEALDRREKKLS